MANPYADYRRKRCSNCGVTNFTDKSRCYYDVRALFGNDHKALDPNGRTCGGDLIEATDTDVCTKAALGHGPGHQSTTECDLKGPHDVHHCTYGSFRQEAWWRGDGLSMSGFFDEPPTEDDQ